MSGSLDEFPRAHVQVEQVAGYRFQATFPGTALPACVVDESPPIGSGAGPDPVLTLATAIGHCLSATLHNTLERARVRASPIRTSVEVVLGRNAKGRKRVISMNVSIACAPLDEADRPRFERSVAVFEDYCTVTGSVREGVQVNATVRPAPEPVAPGHSG